jgi:hypothetical protein
MRQVLPWASCLCCRNTLHPYTKILVNYCFVCLIFSLFIVVNLTLPVTVAARSKGGRTPNASRQASRHKTKATKADVSIMTQTGVRRSHSFHLCSFLCVMSQILCLDCYMSWRMPVCGLPKAWTVFARSDTRIVGSNPTQGMDVCVRLFCVCVVLCVGSDLATGWSLVQGVLPSV